MADTNPQVMEMVEKELKKNRDISNTELLEKAAKVDSNVEELTPRQFNARYPLQVKRAMKPAKRSRKKATTANRTRKRATMKPRSQRRSNATDGKQRDGVRDVLLQLAKDVGNAEGKGDVVDVVAGIDAYVDRVIKAATA